MARSGLAVVNSNGFNGGARGAAGACRSLLISPVRAISAAAQNPLVNINENTSAAAPTKVWAETEAFEIASKNTSAESGAVQHASKITSRNKRGGLPTLGFCRRSLQIVADSAQRAGGGHPTQEPPFGTARCCDITLARGFDDVRSKARRT